MEIIFFHNNNRWSPIQTNLRIFWWNTIKAIRECDVHLLGSSQHQYLWKCIDQIWSRDEPYNWSEDIQFIHPMEHTKVVVRSLLPGEHQIKRGKMWQPTWSWSLGRLWAWATLSSNKYWFRGNKRTWQKPTASSIALTPLSYIGHTVSGDIEGGPEERGTDAPFGLCLRIPKFMD